MRGGRIILNDGSFRVLVCFPSKIDLFEIQRKFLTNWRKLAYQNAAKIWFGEIVAVRS